MDSFAAYSGKLVPIAPQNAQYAVIDDYNKNHPDHQVQLTASENFQVVDAYTWVMEGRYDGYLDIELSFKKNVTDADGPYHQFADRLSYVRYKAIPTYPISTKKNKNWQMNMIRRLNNLDRKEKSKNWRKNISGRNSVSILKREVIRNCFLHTKTHGIWPCVFVCSYKTKALSAFLQRILWGYNQLL